MVIRMRECFLFFPVVILVYTTSWYTSCFHAHDMLYSLPQHMSHRTCVWVPVVFTNRGDVDDQDVQQQYPQYLCTFQYRLSRSIVMWMACLSARRDGMQNPRVVIWSFPSLSGPDIGMSGAACRVPTTAHLFVIKCTSLNSHTLNLPSCIVNRQTNLSSNY